MSKVRHPFSFFPQPFYLPARRSQVRTDSSVKPCDSFGVGARSLLAQCFRFKHIAERRRSRIVIFTLNAQVFFGLGNGITTDFNLLKKIVQRVPFGVNIHLDQVLIFNFINRGLFSPSNQVRR